MKLISVNVGLPREITVSGKTVRTSIWKYPVQGRVHVSTLNLDGDQQSDLSVHGGIDKAVYLYPSEHYSYWQIQLPDVELRPAPRVRVRGRLEKIDDLFPARSFHQVSFSLSSR